MNDRPSPEELRRRPPVSKEAGRGRGSALCGEPPPAELLAGIAQFNRGEYWNQHETLEELWIEEADPVRHLYQGILQVGVAFHHWGRGNFRGADLLLERGIAYLQPFRPLCRTRRCRAADHRRRGLPRRTPASRPAPDAAFRGDTIPQVHLVGANPEISV